MPRPIRTLRAAATPLFLLATFLAAPLRAQDSTVVADSAAVADTTAVPEPYPRGAAVGFSVGQMVLGDFGVFTVSVHATDVRPGRVGVDFAAEVPPRAVSAGVLAGIADLGLAYAMVSDPGVIVLPRLGVSVLGGFGESGAGGVFGFQGGAGLLVRSGRNSAIRLDVAARQYSEARQLVYSLGIGISGFPRGR